MSQPIVLKVYANLAPVGPDIVEALDKLCHEAIAGEDPPSVTTLGDMVRLGFEGLYFPVDEAVAVVEQAVLAGAVGKMDVLDMENWTMTRYEAAKEADGVTPCLKKGTVPLNHVLDFSGF